MISLMLCLGLLIQIPQDYPTITEAIDVSSQGDTILVHPDIYPEQLWLPSHDILLVSEFFFTGDSSALYNTIIDASAWADEDTASAVLILNGSTRATTFSGFTVTGGHGISRGPDPIYRIGGAFFVENSKPVVSSNIISRNQAGGSSAIAAEHSNPVISSNLIYGNRQFGAIIGLYVCSGDTPAIIEANNVGANFELPGDPESCCSQHIGVDYSDVIIRSNYIHDHLGFEAIGLRIRNSKVELSGNVFENLHFRECPLSEPQRCEIVEIRRSEVKVLDNTFLNCSTFERCCLILSEADIYGPTPIVSGNVFENIAGPDGGGYGGAGILVLNSDAFVSHNRFTNCAYGAIGISTWTQFPPCSVFVTENEFIGNDYDELPGVYQASAVNMLTDGTGKAFLSGNTFTDNQKIAVNILYEGSDSLTYFMEAEQNFWGDSSGPYHPILNPTGRGDTIAGRVDFDPWLIENEVDPKNRPSAPVPDGFMLLEPYPNPFNPGVMLPLSITRPGIFKIVVFDLLGRRIWEQTEQLSGVGIHRIYWPGIDSNGQTVTTGIYFARATSANQITHARKLVLLK
ncbi:right-handed parallel beta-helix repeat-containing protein [bacterium]|nr:right-handed parallel beta-helix repeat-containing protein [bacterium]